MTPPAETGAGARGGRKKKKRDPAESPATIAETEDSEPEPEEISASEEVPGVDVTDLWDDLPGSDEAGNVLTDVGGVVRAVGAAETVSSGLPVEVVAPSTALVQRDALGAYLAEIRRYPILSREEEHSLAVRFREEGDLDAAYKLVTSNLRLVVMIAREYQRAFHNLLDLVQEGNIGLLEAVRQFDPYRGVRFPSYAVWWVRAYIIRYVMNNFRLVKVGTTQAQRRLFFNLQKEKTRLEAQGFQPTAKMIADRIGVKEKEVIEMEMRMGASEMSVDAPVRSDGATPIIELLPNDQDTAEGAVADREFHELMKVKLSEFREGLEGRELEIFDERLLAEEPLTLQEFGDRYGVSRERVRQIEEALKNRLREFLVAQVRDLAETIGG